FDVRGLGLSWMNRIANRESERPHEDERGREHEHPLREGCVGRARRVIHYHGDTLACLSDSRLRTSSISSGRSTMTLPRAAMLAGTRTTTSPGPAWFFSA